MNFENSSINSNKNNKHFILQYFLKHVNDNYTVFQNNIIHDRCFINIKHEEIKRENLENIFIKIYEYLKLNKLEKSISWIIKSYLDNNFGVPSSFENIGRYKDCMLKYNKLIKNKYYIKSFNSEFERILINDINGLVKLETYINNPLIKEILQKIDDKNITKKRQKIKKKKRRI